MQESQKTRVWSLGQEDPLEEDMATHSSILAWRIPWTEEPGGLRAMRLQKSRTRLKRFSTRACTFTTSAPRQPCFFLRKTHFNFTEDPWNIRDLWNVRIRCPFVSQGDECQDSLAGGRNLTTLFGAKIPRFHSGFHTDAASTLFLPSYQSWPHTEA